MGVLFGVGDFGLEDLLIAAQTAEQTAVTAKNQAIAAAESVKDGIPQGPWNAASNLPALTANSSAFPEAAFFDVTFGGAAPFSGVNFLAGEMIEEGAKLKRQGTQWYKVPFSVGDNSISGRKISDKAVTPGKTSFMVPGKNLFDKNDPGNVTGKYVRFDTGSLADNATYLATSLIPVSGNTTYSATIIRQTAYYTASKTYISGINITDSTSSFTTPANAAYVRMSIPTTLVNVEAYQIELGSVKTAYEPFSPVLSGVAIPDNSVTANKIANNSINASKLSGGSVTADKISNGAIGSDKIAVEAVSPSQTNFIKPGKNKFNINDSGNVIGKYVSSTNGNLVDNSTYNSTHFIPVIPGTTYYPSFKHQLAFYDSSKIYISGLSNTRTDQFFTVPANAYFVRISVGTGGWNVFQLEEGSTGTAYEAYLVKITGVGVNLNDNDVKTSSIQNNAVTADKIGSGAVTPTKANFLTVETGVNKFNKATVTSGIFMNTNGSTQSNPTYALSDFIPVTENQEYYGKATGAAGSMRFVTYFDANKTVVQPGMGSAGYSFTPPTGVRFVRLTMSIQDLDIFQLQKGSSSLPYQAYEEYYKIAMESGPKLKADAATDTLLSTITDYVKANISVEKPLAEELTIAPKIYWPTNRELAIYPENMMKQWDKWKGHVDMSVSSISNAKQTGRALKLTPVSGPSALIGSVLDANYDQAFSFTSSIIGVGTTNTNPVKIMNIGDSYTYRSSFVNRLMAVVPGGVTFLGTRNTTSSTPTILSEGRGGWLLQTYSVLNKSLYSPFIQPTAGSYLYKGNTEFWIKANAGLSDTVGQGYDYNRFVFADQFDPATGYPKVHRANDVIYDNAQSKFFYSTGSAWVEIAESTLNFGLNFGKYRQCWGVDAPDIVHIMLGTNDFAGSTGTTFVNSWPAYKTRYDALIASIKADVPSVKIIVGVPCSSGQQGNEGVGAFNRRKIAYWLAAKNLIDTYKNRESESIYLADYHSTVDRTFGYGRSYEKPFQNYTGAETLTLTAQQTEAYTSDAVHISPDGFNQEGEQYLALIQYLRSL
ncbi:hypothetical protein BWI93_03065 [Siphonobacter sp. BAB-5385]|uniref:SGNH/GDSL hydrolase family protein n=1 Tax=Siphonobacter sp. BAB-5385 TaxID=1864822 RepID=UPI000B9DD7C9|nr:SGNH/GDSL hydrolase family protein [Siphonobacter sp. BAB-5385]OZI09577.1 hypothetical protein BWI93_03065 [Siphonobacter sp. BAB-5385]